MDLGNFIMTQEQMKQRLLELRKKSQEIPEGHSFLILGEAGSGKSALWTTGRRPILCYHFDPKGINNKEIRQGIKEGWIIIRTFWNEETEHPKVYKDFEDVWKEDVTSGFVNLFGTVVIDSATTFIRGMANYVSKQIYGNRKGDQFFPGMLAPRDYIILYNVVRDVIKISQAEINLDFMMTGHLSLDKDEVTGKMIATLATFNQLKFELPALFTEKYVLLQDGKGGREVLTSSKDRYTASTQMGGHGIFKQLEEANIKYLLNKAGKDSKDNAEGMKILGL